ncbi:AvrD family protein [Nocardia sp. NPDC052566]|uniref:AvrD family protein n=1 Tax=Nocardia sp. NPDC052566 TaxID=3364330 RepID=UPI0037CA023A
MTARVVSNRQSFDTIDDYLGPREHRFFGEGFKRAAHRITDVRIHPAGDGTGIVTSTVGVEYPADWSRKGDHDQRAHLSTVDVLVLAARLIETYLTRVRGLTRGQLATAVLEQVSVRAGAAPVEDDLRGFPASARISSAAAAADGSVTTVAECAIGTLTLRCRVRHEAGTGVARSPHWFEELREPGPYLFAEDYTARKQFLEAVTVHRVHGQALATVRIHAPRTGLPASALVVDTFVVGLQLGQLLLYELDGLSRADSDTLWMRRTIVECGEHQLSRVPAAPAVARLENSKLIEKSGNQVWRIADIVCEFQQIEMRCSVAHRIRSTGGQQ